MTDVFNTLFGGPSKEEVLGNVRLETWKSFESVKSFFNDPQHDFSDPAVLKGLLMGLMLRVVAESSISDILAHAPSDALGAAMYPKQEAIAVIREEMSRVVTGDGTSED